MNIKPDKSASRLGAEDASAGVAISLGQTLERLMDANELSS